METSPIRTVLTRSHGAWRRHTRVLSAQIDELRQPIAVEFGVDIDALDTILFTIGDEETKKALAVNPTHQFLKPRIKSLIESKTLSRKIPKRGLQIRQACLVVSCSS